jgi:hypothetical protein
MRGSAALGLLCTALACSGATPASVPPRDARTASPAATAPTAEQLAASGEAIVRRGMLIAQTVRKKLEDARRGVDIIKATCLDDKRTEIDVNVRTAEARLGTLQRAADRERRLHEHTVLGVLDRRLQTLAAEAAQCLGQAMYDTGQLRLVAEADPALVPFEETPSQPPVIEPAGVVPPPPAGPR